jgi:hypothetical protein
MRACSVQHKALWIVLLNANGIARFAIVFGICGFRSTNVDSQLAVLTGASQFHSFGKTAAGGK